jgi:hypothetical protein
METEIVTSARTEQRSLEEQIRVLDEQFAAYERNRKALATRLEAVKALRAAYGDADPSGLESVLSAVAQLGNAMLKPQVARENSHKARVLAAAFDLLSSGSPTPTRELLEKIEQRGIQFNAANKAGQLSVLLSKDDRFISDRKAGWRLKGESPAGAGLSNAMASGEAQPTSGV